MTDDALARIEARLDQIEAMLCIVLGLDGDGMEYEETAWRPVETVVVTSGVI